MKKPIIIGVGIGIVFVIVIVLILLLTPSKKILSLSDYSKYQDQITTYNDMVYYFGSETTDIGSGLHVYQYTLTDGYVLFSFANLDEKPVAVNCMDKNVVLIDCN